MSIPWSVTIAGQTTTWLLVFLNLMDKRRGIIRFNTKSGYLSKINKVDLDRFGDGHLTALKNKIIADTYPGRDRFQHLICFNLGSGETDVLGSFYSPIQYFGEGRCDLHPRISANKNEYILIAFIAVKGSFATCQCPKTAASKNLNALTLVSFFR